MVESLHRLRIRRISAMAVGGVLAVWLATAAYPTATIYQTPDTFSLRNEYLEFTLRYAGQMIEFSELVNKTTGQHYSLRGYGPRIHLVDGRILRLADFERTRAEKRPDYSKKKESFAFSVINRQLDLELMLVFELGHEDRFVRESLEIGAASSDLQLAIRGVDLFAGPLGSAYQGGGRGQPLFIDDSVFIGGESPIVYNYVHDGSVFVSTYPYVSLRTAEDLLKINSLVYGVADRGQVVQTFIDGYVRTLDRLHRDFLVYNTRYDLRGAALTAQNVASHVTSLARTISSASGGRLDGGIIEDDWQERKSLYDFNQQRFPQGLATVRSVPGLGASNLGVGLSLSGGRMDPAWARQQGYQLDPAGRYVYINGPRYFEAAKPRMETFSRANEPFFIEHLDVQFASVASASGDVVDGTRGLDGSVRAWKELIDELRKARSTCQWYAAPAWPSPWWVSIVDGVAISGPRQTPPLCWNQPVALPRDAATTAAAGELRDFIFDSGCMLPLSAVVDDSIVAGAAAGLSATHEPLERWSDSVLLAVARGSRIKQLSLDADRLGPVQSLVLGRLLAWGQYHRNLLAESHCCGGDPRRGEIYGFVAHDPSRALLVLRNPKLSPDQYTLSMEALFGPGPGRFYAWIAYPYRQKLHDRLNRSFVVDVPLSGLETVVVEVETANTARVRPDLAAFWDVPVAATAYLQVKGRGVTVARPVTSASAALKVETDRLTQTAQLGVLFRGTTDVTREYQLHVRVNGASVAVERRLSGPDWQMLLYPLAPGDDDVRVWLEENPVAAERKTQSFSLWGLVAGVPDSVSPALRFRSPADARQLPAFHSPGHRNVTPIVGETALPRSAYRATLLDDEATVRRARGARILMKVFGSDAGGLADKWLLLNGRRVGRLPANQEPVDTWQAVVVAVPQDMIPQIGRSNRLVLENPAGDYFKIKDVALMIDTGVDSWKGSDMDRTVYSTGGDWPHREGTVFKDKTPEIKLDFQVKKRP